MDEAANEECQSLMASMHCGGPIVGMLGCKTYIGSIQSHHYRRKFTRQAIIGHPHVASVKPSLDHLQVTLPRCQCRAFGSRELQSSLEDGFGFDRCH